MVLLSFLKIYLCRNNIIFFQDDLKSQYGCQWNTNHWDEPGYMHFPMFLTILVSRYKILELSFFLTAGITHATESSIENSVQGNFSREMFTQKTLKKPLHSF